MVAVGTNSCSSSSRFGPTSTFNAVTPVRLPPGRLRLATRPTWTGSTPVVKTIGIVVVAAFAASAAGTVACGNHGHLTTNQIGRQRRQSIVLALRPAILDRHVLTLDIAGFLQALAERGHVSARIRSGDAPLRNPITGIAGCCARAASGHAAAAPPSSVTNSRRLMPGMGSLPGAAADHSR